MGDGRAGATIAELIPPSGPEIVPPIDRVTAFRGYSSVDTEVVPALIVPVGLFLQLHQDVVGQAARTETEPMVAESLGAELFLHHYQVVQGFLAPHSGGIQSSDAQIADAVGGTRHAALHSLLEIYIR